MIIKVQFQENIIISSIVFTGIRTYNPTSQEIYNCRRERLKVQACAVREKQVMLGKIGPLGWNTKKYLTETKIKIRNKNWILQLFSFKVHVIPQIPFFLSFPHPLKKYTNYKTKTAMLQSTLIRETNWKVQLLRNTQIVWSYPPLHCTLQHQEICLPDDHTPIFDFPLNHDTGII